VAEEVGPGGEAASPAAETPRPERASGSDGA
jgi:hypothetical protein